MPANDRPRGFMVWVADFLSDPEFAMMTTTQAGAFWLLLLYAAQKGGSLPNDDAVLARLARLSPEEWSAHREAVLRAWTVTPERIVQKRLRQEVAAAAARKQAASMSGALGAKARWGTKLHGDAIGDAMARPSLIGSGSGEGLVPATQERPSSPDPEANKRDVRDLVGGLTQRMDGTVPPSTKLAWDWLTANTAPDEAKRAMAFVGWLMKTGTKDGMTLLALVKHYVVHRPENPHAYYTPNGAARTVVAMGIAADRAVAEHERIKREERAFLGRSR